MADIRVGVVFDTSTIKAQAVKAGQEVRAAVNQANPAGGGGLATGTGGLARSLGRTSWEQAARDAMAAQLRRQRAAAAEARAAAQTARAAQTTAATNVVGSVAGRFGLSGLGTALRAGPVGLAVAGAAAALLMFARTVHRVMESLDEARQRYATQLTSGGLPGGFTTTRSTLAEVIGVSEREVLQYGDAVSFLNERLRLSNQELARTTKVLTTASWNWRVLGINLRALWAQIAAEMAPTIGMIAKALSAWIEFVREIGLYQGIAKAVSTALSLLALAFTAAITPMMLAITAIVSLGDAIQYFVRQVMNSYYRVTGQTDKISDEDTFAETKKAWAAVGKLWGSMGRRDASESVPNPSANYRKLEASPWERMGLVIGSGVGTNPARETARNTRKTVELLKEIKNLSLPRSGGVPMLPKTAKQSP